MHSLPDAEIIELYVTNSLSVQQIAERLQISPYAVRKCLYANGVEIRSISEAILSIYRTKFGKKGFSIKGNRSSEEELLLVAGIMLYWGEGYKRGNEVAFTNSDPDIIRLFLKFLRVICGVAEVRLRVCIHAYEDHDLNALTKFWSMETGIPMTQFIKPYIHFRKRATYRKPSLYGTIAVRYCDKKLLQQILSWIQEYSLRFK